MRRRTVVLAAVLVVSALGLGAAAHLLTTTPHGRLDLGAAIALRLTPPMQAGDPGQIAAEREAMRQMMARLPSRPVPMMHVEDRSAPGPAGHIPVRLYHPAGPRPQPAVVFLHGGGFCLGCLETHQHICCQLAERAGAVVVAVDYRLAPEHPFPAAIDDALAAFLWVHREAAKLGIDPARIAVAGDSAGGNLAAVTALRCRERGGPRPAFQLLIYPPTDLGSFDTPSHRAFAEGFVLTRSFMVAMHERYLPDPADRTHPHASPLHAHDLSGLPPALVITAEFDPLRDEGEAYARALHAAGVPVTAHRYRGVTHGFFGVPLMRDGRRALADAAAALRAALAPPRTMPGAA